MWFQTEGMNSLSRTHQIIIHVLVIVIRITVMVVTLHALLVNSFGGTSTDQELRFITTEPLTIIIIIIQSHFSDSNES